MALDAGGVEIDDQGNPSGGGLARRLYDRLIADVGEIGPESTPTAQTQVAALSNSLAAAIVDEITENAEVRITTNDGELQTLPDPPNAGEPTEPPDATKTLRVY